ncbi:ABC transporter ATP-binding protein [Microbacterium excoecariae]|uniref:ABC transporter ATP-binding protein n=1 Tax=Microbacterium excoecariae TaxID=2715210 RepID=UPI00140DB00C|nr:ATP-binding cassette domain-containing protein [Microbacterium excoecariae]NHI17437.1 ATP-binding cassette domain-containing protein [Microbacterium excoecariae]
MNPDPLLALDRATVRYRGSAEPALSETSLEVPAGGRLAIVGESGAGKSTILRLLLGIENPTAGSVRYAGQALARRDRARMRAFRRDVQCVFQDPRASLDPRRRVGATVAEPLVSLGLARGAEARARVARALARVGLPEDAARRFPHEFSGGQRQRIAIARAIVARPRVLLADEPVSALDVTTRVAIVDLLQELLQGEDMALVMVSHDLGVVAELCRESLVLERGRIVERGATSTVLAAPRHPYTRALVEAVPRLPPA